MDPHTLRRLRNPIPLEGWRMDPAYAPLSSPSPLWPRSLLLLSGDIRGWPGPGPGRLFLSLHFDTEGFTSFGGSGPGRSSLGSPRLAVRGGAAPCDDRALRVGAATRFSQSPRSRAGLPGFVDRCRRRPPCPGTAERGPDRRRDLPRGGGLPRPGFRWPGSPVRVAARCLAVLVHWRRMELL